MGNETFEAWWLTEAALGDAVRDKEVARIAWRAARTALLADIRDCLMRMLEKFDDEE